MDPMLTKRIIPCLDIRRGRVVKGIHFLKLKDAGDPAELAAQYVLEGADELVFLDITATEERRQTLYGLVKKIASCINIPFTVGGGISSVADVEALLQAGADKVSINSAAILRPDLINDLSNRFGSQCIVLAIDALETADNNWEVYRTGGHESAGFGLYDWAQEGVERGAGEILFTAMNRDGTKSGFACDALQKMSTLVNVPVIASGGAGKEEHFAAVFRDGQADAALAASVFHFGELRIPELKNYLQQQNIPVRN